MVAVVDGSATGFDPINWSRTIARAALEAPAGSFGQDIIGVADVARHLWGDRPVPSLPPGIQPKATGATVGLLRFERDQSGISVRGEFVGDVSAMVYRQGAVPLVLNDLSSGSLYDSSPQTLNTTPRQLVRIRQLRPIRIEARDVVFTYTDGFGKWLVDRAGQPNLLEHLRHIDARSFVDLVRAEQRACRMEVDDVMLVRTTVSGSMPGSSLRPGSAEHQRPRRTRRSAA